jgi:hypothetical protein
MDSYRAIHLGGDKWAVRKFSGEDCYEKRIILHVDDPQLRSSDKKAIAAAEASKEPWTKV